jgi:hypothetical protein
MPTYTFKNSNTEEIEEHIVKLSDYDKFQEDNTHLVRYFSVENLPGFGDGARMNTPGVGRADSTFEKYVINRIKESVPGNNLAKSHKTKIPKEF